MNEWVYAKSTPHREKATNEKILQDLEGPLSWALDPQKQIETGGFLLGLAVITPGTERHDGLTTLNEEETLLWKALGHLSNKVLQKTVDLVLNYVRSHDMATK